VQDRNNANKDYQEYKQVREALEARQAKVAQTHAGRKFVQDRIAAAEVSDATTLHTENSNVIQPFKHKFAPIPLDDSDVGSVFE